MGVPGSATGTALLARISGGAYPLWAPIAELARPMDLTALEGLCKNVVSRRVERVESNTERGELRR